MLSKRDAIKKLRKLMAAQYPRVKKYIVVATPVLLAYYGNVVAYWDSGKKAIELPEPYLVVSR